MAEIKKPGRTEKTEGKVRNEIRGILYFSGISDVPEGLKGNATMRQRVLNVSRAGTNKPDAWSLDPACDLVHSPLSQAT